MQSASFPTPSPVPTVTPTERPPFQRVFANSAADDDLIVGAHYYPWYSERTHWNEGRTDTPTRGDYDSRDLRTINQHIDEATGHGIDFFNISWWGPGSWEDNTLKDAILRADLIDDISFTIFYETLGRLIHTSGDVKVNLDNAANRATLVDDFKYLAEEYFDHPSYLRIDGKPVVVIYLTRTFTGDVAGAISHLRSELLSVGHDLFIVADEVYWQDPLRPEVIAGIRNYDAVFAYNMHYSQPVYWQDPLRPEVIAGIRNYDAVFAYNMHYSQPEVGERFVERSLDHYRRWATATSKAGTDFIPGVMPGFDARYIRSPNPYVVERSAERFAQFTTGGLDLLGPHTPCNAKYCFSDQLQRMARRYGDRTIGGAWL